MKVIIPLAGKGTRLRPHTHVIPKPLIKIAGKPMMAYILEKLERLGTVEQVIYITGHLKEKVEEYVRENWQLPAVFVEQVVQDGTGKAAHLARDFVGAASFLLTYGDILVRPETYPQMVRRYNEGHFSGVITVTRGQDVTKGAVNFFDEQFCLTRLIEKPTPGQLEQLQAEGLLRPGAPVWYNAGIYIFRPSLFEFTAKLQPSPRGEYELTDAVAGLVAAHHRLAGLEIQGRWVDVRDPEVLAALQQGA